jgi:hypothetical protein
MRVVREQERMRQQRQRALQDPSENLFFKKVGKSKHHNDQWHIISPKTSIHPDSKKNAGMTVVGDKAYIYGGMAGYGRSATLSVLDMQTLEWTALDRKEQFGGTVPPPARAGHSFTNVGEHIFVYGGEGRPEKGPNPQANKVKGNGENKTRTLANRVDYGDFWRLDTKTMKWDQLLMRGAKIEDPEDAASSMVMGSHKASFPSARREHAVCEVVTTPPIVEGEFAMPNQHHLWLFGGAGPDPTLGVECTFNDLWRMDVTDTGGQATSFKWVEQRVTGSPLPRRWGHTLTHIPHSNALAIIGGEGPPNGEIDLRAKKKVVKRTIEARRKSIAMTQCEGLVVIVNLETFVCSWLNLNPVFSPGWVVGHTAAPNPRMPGCVYIFGGRIASQPGASKSISAHAAVEQAPLVMLNMRGKINDGEFDGIPCWQQVQFEVAEPPPPTPPDGETLRNRKEAEERAKHVPPDDYTRSGVIDWEKKSKLEDEARRQRVILRKAGKDEDAAALQKGVAPVWSAPARREGHVMALVGNHGMLVHGGIFANLRRFKGDRKIEEDNHVIDVAKRAISAHGMGTSLMTSAQKAEKEQEDRIKNTPIEQGTGHAAPNLYYLHFSHYNLAPDEHQAPVTNLNPSAMLPIKVKKSKPQEGVGLSPVKKRNGNKEGATKWGGEWQDEDNEVVQEVHLMARHEEQIKKSKLVAQLEAAERKKQIKQSLKKQRGFGAAGSMIQNQMRRRLQAARHEMEEGLTPHQIEAERVRMERAREEEYLEMKRQVKRKNAKSTKGHNSTKSIFKSSCPVMKVKKGGKNRGRNYDDDSLYGDDDDDNFDDATPRRSVPTSQSVAAFRPIKEDRARGGRHMATSMSYDADAMAQSRQKPAAENLRFKMEGREDAVHMQVPGAGGIALGSAVGLSAGGVQLSHQEAKWHLGGGAGDNNSDYDDEDDYKSDAGDSMRPPGAHPSIFSSAAASALGKSGRSEKWSSTRVPHLGEDGIGDKGSDLSYDNFKLICGDPVKHMSTRFELDKTYKAYPAIPKKSLSELCPELKKKPKVPKWRSSMEGMPVTNSTLRQVLDDARDMTKSADCLGYPIWT